MLLYRVFPHLPFADPGEPGHPLYLSARQGSGRWDNPELYQLSYLAHSPEGAIGEAFGMISRWVPGMLAFPELPGATRRLGVYSVDEETHPCLDLDDSRALGERGLRPTDVVVRNRPKTQAISARVFREDRWSGVQWWSHQRPQRTLCAIWDRGALAFSHAEDLVGHPGLADAARELAKERDRI